MPPFDYSIIKGVATIMISYSSFNGVKMHANHDLITSFLKNTLNFRVIELVFFHKLQVLCLVFTNNFPIAACQGFVISDYKGIDQITSPIHANYTYSILAGVGAGIDMVSLSWTDLEFYFERVKMENYNIVELISIYVL